MGDDDATSMGRAGGVPGAGLCNGCALQRVVRSGRGSLFTMCRRAVDDPRWPKYPPVPVVRCSGYVRSGPDGGSED